MNRHFRVSASIIVALITCLLGVGAALAQSPTVTTDKQDYIPGQTVTITGAGWQPGETVLMVLLEEPAAHEALTLSSVADENGAFTNADFVIQEHDFGVKFTLTATGQTSGWTAQAEFTDAGDGFVWTGMVSSDWFDPLNWSPWDQGLPGSGDDIVIPARTNQPVINGGLAQLRELRLLSGTILTVNGGTLRVEYNLSMPIGSTFNMTNGTLQIDRDMFNAGTFNATGGTVIFNGVASTAARPKGTFHNVQINAGANPGFNNYSLTDASFISVGGNWTNNGTAIVNITAHFFGSSTNKIEGANPTTFHHLNILGSRIVAITAPTVGGAFTIANGATYVHTTPTTIPGGFSSVGFPPSSTYEIQNAGMIFRSSIFGNLTINFTGSGDLNTNGFTAVIRGDLHVQDTGTGSFTITGGLGISGNLVVDAGKCNLSAVSVAGNIQLNGGTLQQPSTGSSSLSVSGEWINNGGNYLPGSGEVRFLSTATDQTISGTATSQTFNNVSINKPGRTLSVGGSTTALNVNGLTNSAGTFAAPASLNIAGNWSNTGTFLHNTGIVTMNGANSQSISGATTFNNLIIDNSAGVSLASDETVVGALTLQNGNILTNTNKMIISSGGVVSRPGGTPGYIIGNLQKHVSAGSSVSQPFEVGTASGYNPVTVTFADVSTAGDLTASVIANDHNDIASSTLDENKSVNAYWSLTNAEIVFSSANATFNFNASDLDAGADFSNLELGKFDNSTWSYPVVGTRTATSTEAIGMTNFSDFQLAEGRCANPPGIGTITVPAEPTLVNTAINASADFTSECDNDDHSATWDWGDNTTSEGTVDQSGNSVTGSHSYTAAGAYKVTLTVTDGAGRSGESTATEIIVIYDPDAGFATGSGWIESPPGAYPINPSLTGIVRCGFVSKYQTGQATPIGNILLEFKMADVKFKSTSYEYLVISGANAKYKGSGTINGEGDYGFMVFAKDGQVSGDGVDKFRIKIWKKDADKTIVYDNQMGDSEDGEATTAIEGGVINIQGDGVHKTTQEELASEVIPESYALEQNYPNPFNPSTTIKFDLPEASKVTLKVYSEVGQLVAAMVEGEMNAGRYAISWDGRNQSGARVASGVYLYQLVARRSNSEVIFALTKRMTLIK